MKITRLLLTSSLIPALFVRALSAASAPPSVPGPADLMFAEYFRAETARLAEASLADIRTLEDWKIRQAAYREQLLEMLGLSPLPERTDLKPVVTGRVEHPEFTVEKLHFQSLPGLYVTANLYVPRALGGKKAPAILYACGHAVVKDGETVLGNKTGYQHHGAWFARHGYVCLAIDTIQLGELEGVHHGTRRFGMYWWNSRGYTPAGVEAWNGMRAVDYLQSRPEVDPERIGMTGRSGGGAYTWYTAALDERIRVAVPVAGITDLRNHVVDGVVKGHCDCMYLVNTHRWDYGHLAALLAPRPLLIANTDKDPIFPLDGVVRVHAAAARIYALHKASDRLGLLITEGPHKDTQDLQVPAFRWFNRFLKREEPLITTPAEKLFEPRDLRVFAPGTKPADERTTKIHETFVPAARPALPADNAAWTAARDGWRRDLRAKSFAGWPAAEEPLRLTRLGSDASGARWEFTTQGPVRLPLIVRPPAGGARPSEVVLHVVARDEPMPAAPAGAAVVTFFPRGLGPTASALNAADQNEVRRRYLLVGQTVDGMRVWDIRRAVAALRSPELFGDTPVRLVGHHEQAVNAVYASLFIDGLTGVELRDAPTSHREGPDYLNVLRFLDVPQAVAMAAERHPVSLPGANRDAWSWAAETARRLRWPADRLKF